jgi:hypothetical protein
MFNSQGHRKLWLAAATAGLFIVVGCSNQATNQGQATPVAKKTAPAKPAAGNSQTATPAAKETAKQAKTEAGIHQATGTISMVTGTRLVLSHKVLKVKSTETTFVLNPKTKKEGHLKIGAKATVSYRVEKNEKIATRVTVRQAKPAAKPEAEKDKT